MMRKRALVIFIVGILMLSACSSNEQLLLPEDELSGELVIALDGAYRQELPYNSLAPESLTKIARHRPMHQKIQKFMDLHPKVTVKIVHTNWFTREVGIRDPNLTGYYNLELDKMEHALPFSILSQIDIIELTPHQVRFAASDYVHDLSFFIENMPAVRPWSEEYMNLIDIANVDGKTFLLPIRSDPMLVYFAAPIFNTLGIEAPTDEWTWEDYFQLTRQLQQLGYVVGDLLRLPSIEHIIHAHGGTFISSDYTDFAGYIDSEATIQAFENYIQAISPVQEPFMLSRWGTSRRLTSTWPALGMARSSSLYHLFDSLDGIDREYDIAPMPLTENGERVNTTLLTGLALTNASQDKELAWEFMKFIIEDDDEDAMHFVANNTLLVQEERYATRPPAQYEKLLQFIQRESAYAHVSSLSMIPTFVGGKVDIFYNPPWNIPEDVDLSRYLPDLALSLEEIRDKMIERGLGGPVIDYK